MMKTMRRMVGLVMVLVAGCAPRYASTPEQKYAETVATPYQEMDTGFLLTSNGKLGFGYENSLDAWTPLRTVRVVTNKFTGSERTRQMALLRAAEIGMEKGYSKFRVTHILTGRSCRDQRLMPKGDLVVFRVLYGKAGEVLDGHSRWSDQITHGQGEMYQGSSFNQVDLDYEVEAALRDLTPKVRDKNVSSEDAKANEAQFDTTCLMAMRP